jgi:hypothetical protein
LLAHVGYAKTPEARPVSEIAGAGKLFVLGFKNQPGAFAADAFHPALTNLCGLRHE